MTYSPDMRAAALRCVSEGKRHSEIIEFFNISLKTLSNWLRQYREEGMIEVLPRKPYKKRKVDRDALARAVEDKPDATLEELAEPFGVYPSTIDYHLRKLKITRKKNHAVSGAGRGKKARVHSRD